MLVFDSPNAKLIRFQEITGRVLRAFSLPAGRTCPAAKTCWSRANRDNETGERLGPVIDGPETIHRCYAASEEQRFPHVFNRRMENFSTCVQILKDRGPEGLADAFDNVVGKAVIRIHPSGDFFSYDYLRAWCLFASRRADAVYAYTKSVHFVEQAMRENIIPGNMTFLASMGGEHDQLAMRLGMRTAVIVQSEEEAARLGLPVDHDDTLAANPAVPHLALLVHGTQPAGSEAGKAVARLRTLGIGGYSRQPKQPEPAL